MVLVVGFGLWIVSCQCAVVIMPLSSFWHRDGMDIGKVTMVWMLAVSVSRLMHNGGAVIGVRGVAVLVGFGLGVGCS